MSSWRRRLVLVVAIALTTTTACLGDDPDPGASAPREIRIGLLAPLTGANKGAGVDIQRGAKLAEDIVNGANPSIPLPLAEGSGLPALDGARIRVLVSDTASKAQQGADATTALIANQRVAAIVGAYDAEVTLDSSQRSERLGIPYLNADSTLSFLTERGLDWFFRLGPSVRDTGEAFFSLLQNKAKDGERTERVAVLYTADKIGNDIATEIGKLASEGRYQVVANVAVAPNEGSFTAAIDRIKAAQPHAAFVSISAQAMPALLNDFAAQTYIPPGVFAFSHGYLDPNVLKNAGDALSGISREISWSVELAERNRAAQAVRKLYQEKFNAPMSEDAASAFTGVLTLAQAIDRGRSAEPRAIRSSLLSLDVPGAQLLMPWQGIRFDETHQNIRAQAVVEQFVGGTFRAVFPTDASTRGTRGLIWPASSAAGAPPPA